MGEATVWLWFRRADLHAGMDAGEVAGTLAGLEGVRYANVAVTAEGSSWVITLDAQEAARLATNGFSYAFDRTEGRPDGGSSRDRQTANRAQELAADRSLDPLVRKQGRRREVTTPLQDSWRGCQDLLWNRCRRSERVRGDAPPGPKAIPGKSSSWTPRSLRKAASWISAVSAMMRTNFPAAGPTVRSNEVPGRSGSHAGVFPEDWQDHALIHYGDDVVEITRDMAAADVTAALESLETVRDVWVGGAGTSATRGPWRSWMWTWMPDGAQYLLAARGRAQCHGSRAGCHYRRTQEEETRVRSWFLWASRRPHYHYQTSSVDVDLSEGVDVNSIIGLPGIPWSGDERDPFCSGTQNEPWESLSKGMIQTAR